MSKIDSPVAGVLMQYEVKVGDAVTEGQEVALMESMKMEIPVDAPRDGTVAKVAVAEKEVVKEGQVLLVLE